ncbi:phosphopantetheine-binding protein, partial [Streptomyces hygroscopicus]|uniref:phosphopantetheine-binding protein n=1 Tax=Streptomyces hygroscopicus TaxID=1912 RepID=UPI0033D16A40
LPGVSVAWGLWEQRSAMTEGLDDTDLTRIARMGVLPMRNDDGLRLFDAAAGSARSLVVAAELDSRALGTADMETPVQPMLRGLVERQAPPRRRWTASAGHEPQPDGAPLARQLAGLGEGERRRVLLHTVREHAATVLGHGSAASIPAEQGFLDMGFDSLTAVELRNRLSAATGLRLPATLVFNHPDATRLADHLGAELMPPDTVDDADTALRAELDRLETRLHDSAAATDDATRAMVVTRLQDLLSHWSAAPNGSTAGNGSAASDDAGTGGAADVAENLESAGADELFSFIDREFGSH